MTVVDVQRDEESLSLTLVAQFDAPVEQVWQLWADPRRLERWWGPPGYPATVETHALVAGGEVRYVMTGPGGERHYGMWLVTSVDPPTSLTFTDVFANAEGSPNPDLPAAAARMRLSEHAGGTRMELHLAFESGEHMQHWESFGTAEGLQRSIGQMDALLASTDHIESPRRP